MPNLSTIRSYEVQDRLGEGAGGTVYRAFDTHLRRPVVIKLLHRRADEDLMARLLAEARMASAIEHPNVCSVYEAGEIDGQPFLVMQYVAGRTLLEHVSEGALGQLFALSLGVQIAAGLAAAHGHGILHRDLKPANVMVTAEGLAKILDFGLARRTASPEEAPALVEGTRSWAELASSRFGTTAYMAPEQFATGRSTEQSDLWALGVILYEMVTGRHPFWMPSAEQAQLARAIQGARLAPPRSARADLHPAFEEVILKAMARQPDDRYRHASEIRDALRTLGRTLDPDAATPGEPGVPPPTQQATTPRTNVLSRLADRLLPARSEAPAANTVAVLPFLDIGTDAAPRFYGFAFADAAATRLARAPALVVRPPRLLRAAREPLPDDPAEAARRLGAAFALTGRFARSPDGFLVSWQLLATETGAVVAGRTVEVRTEQLVMAQQQVSDAVFAVLSTVEALPITTPPALRPAAAVGEAAIPEAVAEDYLAARALLDRQATRSGHEDELHRAMQTFEHVTERAPDFAPAHASLGIALTRYVRFGYGGVRHLIGAQRSLERALELDPSNIEAKLYRAYTLLWRGDKEEARRDVQYLLQTAAYDAEVHIGAGVILHLDGLLDASLHHLSTALRVAPGLGPRVYNLRARVNIYALRPAAARTEILRGLALEPRHMLLRTTHGVWHLRHGDRERALALLEEVAEDDPHLRLTHPTLAIALHLDGQTERADALMSDETLAMATADCEMAYRVATYFAVAGDVTEARHWLRKTIFLGNHNAPWFRANPHWATMREDPEIRQTLDELYETQRGHLDRWQHVLPEASSL